MSTPSSRGFTLLEVMVAMAILGVSLLALFDLNAGAIANHSYSKKLTVASLLARSKMTDLEQELYDKGLQADDDEDAGDFSQEGWPGFKWRARILAPKTNGLSPQQLLGAVFGLPVDGESEGPLAALLGGGGIDTKSNPKGGPTPVPGSGGLAGMAGMAGGGLMQAQFGQMVEQITKSVREVHLTVTWKEGKQVESVDVVTHIVSLGPGSDRNGPSNAEAAVANAQNQLGGANPNNPTLPPGQQLQNPFGFPPGLNGGGLFNAPKIRSPRGTGN